MTKINYKDDFDFILRLYTVLTDSSGNEVEGSRKEIGWPEYDWVATFWTSSKANPFVARARGGECVNCYNDNGQIHIVADNHRLGKGRLNVEFTAELPRGIYADGYQRNVIPAALDIELIAGTGDLPRQIQAELLLPYIKGDKGDKGDAFTYADFTDEEIAELQKPATDAANELEGRIAAIEKRISVIESRGFIILERNKE